MDEELVIFIPSPSDLHLGYLNISNAQYPFVLENKIWKTVEHYMIAKCFEGTFLEEQIRNAKNVFIARILAKPKTILVEEDGRTVRKHVYGNISKDEICYSKRKWGSLKREYLESATKAKFSAPRALSKLLKTEGMRIIDSRDEDVGFALEKIRDDILNERMIVKPPPKRKFAAPYADVKVIPGGEILGNDQIFLENIINGIASLKQVENIKKDVPITTEMIEDAFYNLLVSNGVHLNTVTEILDSAKSWMAEMIKTWNDVIKNMPNFELLTSKVSGHLFPGVLGAGAKTKLKTSIFMATLIRWVKMDATPDERKILYSKITISSENFILPPLRREYRKNVNTPPIKKLDVKSNVPNTPVKSLPKKSLSAVTKKKINKAKSLEKHALRGARYIELFRKIHNLDAEQFSKVVTHLEKMSRLARKEWLKSFENLNMAKQKEKLKTIL